MAAAIDRGLYRPHEPREIVDLLWGLFLGIVHLSETRANLGVRVSTLRDLHRKAFVWFEDGLRLPPAPERSASEVGRKKARSAGR